MTLCAVYVQLEGATEVIASWDWDANKSQKNITCFGCKVETTLELQSFAASAIASASYAAATAAAAAAAAAPSETNQMVLTMDVARTG